MDKDQKRIVVDQVASQIEEAEAVIAVDYRGIDVPQVNELRMRLREADATFRVVKNSLTERAADKAGEPGLKALLDGPTAFTFVRGDIAMAAKALNRFASVKEVIEFKGGYMDGAALSVDEIVRLAKLPTSEQLRAQLVGTIVSPVSGLVRGLNSMIGGLAVALSELQKKREIEEPDQAEPVAEAEESGGDEPEAEHSKAEEPKAEELKAEDSQAEESEAEGSQNEKPEEGEDSRAEKPSDGDSEDEGPEVEELELEGGANEESGEAGKSEPQAETEQRSASEEDSNGDSESKETKED